MAILKFPSVFTNGNLPLVIFTPKVYNCPTPLLASLVATNSSSSINDTVALYLSNDYNESISSEWGLQDVYGGTAPTVFGSMVSEVANRFKDADNGKVVASVSSAKGVLPYPTDVAIFKGVSPMTLNFSFNMIPYNQAEGNTIVKIIQNFKKAIMPRMSGGMTNALLKFPDIWDINFENINGLGIEKKEYLNMCLTSCNVQFVSNTENASVYHDDNPTQVKLSLSFQSMMKQFLQG